MTETSNGQQSPEQAAAKQQFDYNLAMAFGETPPTINDDSNPTTDQTNPEGITNTTTDNPSVPTEGGEVSFDETDYLKNNFGWETREAALAEIQELRKLKEAPLTPAEIQYANEESKKWHTYLKEGKEDDLYQSLHARQQIKNIDSLNDEQRLKLFIKMNNPLFDQELIDYQFKNEYSFDDTKYKDDEGLVIDPMGLRYAKIAAQQKMQNDLNKANDYFGQYKSKIELPDINPTQNNIDQEYEEFKASNAKSSETYANVIVPAINALKEADLQLKVKVEDPNNQMQFEVSILPETTDFTAVKNDSLNFMDWVSKTFYDEKGNFNAVKLNRAILLERNFDKYAQSIARQAVNAERKRVVEKNSTGGKQDRDFNVNPQAMNELQKQFERAMSV